MKFVLTGATGFIGKKLTTELARNGHQVIALTRNLESASHLPCESILWNPNDTSLKESSQIAKVLENADAVIHLAGSSIAASRWTEKEKTKIRESRIKSTQKLIKAIQDLPPSLRPKSFLCASAVGYYGDRKDEVLTEESHSGHGFLAQVVKDWEQEADKAKNLVNRVLKLRISIVLGSQGGLLTKIKPIVLGSGNQWVSWIHIDDVVGIICFLLTENTLEDCVHVTAPNPVRNRDFARALSRIHSLPFLPKIPEWVLRKTLGEMADLLFESVNAIPQKITKAGLLFQYPKLEMALKEIYGKNNHHESKFHVEQYIASPLPDVFQYFSEAENLETLTPPWLHFHILAKTTKKVQENTVIDYKLKIRGIPIRWQSRIQKFTPNKSFVDIQLRGPYAKWEHTHLFEKVYGGTLITDDVVYKVPGGSFGKWVGGSMVRKEIEKIFSYRKKKIAVIFKK